MIVDVKEVDKQLKNIEKRISNKGKQIKEKRSYLLGLLVEFKSQEKEKEEKDIETENSMTPAKVVTSLWKISPIL